MRAADYLELPEQVENEVKVALPASARENYRKMEREHLLELAGAEITAASAAAVMGKLLQLSGGAVYDDEGGFVEFHDEKIKALKDIIDTAGGPVLVFYGLVFVPKYRRKVMYGEVRKDIVEILKHLCQIEGIELIEGAVCKRIMCICMCPNRPRAVYPA